MNKEQLWTTIKHSCETIQDASCDKSAVDIAAKAIMLACAKYLSVENPKALAKAIGIALPSTSTPSSHNSTN